MKHLRTIQLLFKPIYHIILKFTMAQLSSPSVLSFSMYKSVNRIHAGDLGIILPMHFQSHTFQNQEKVTHNHFNSFNLHSNEKVLEIRFRKMYETIGKCVHSHSYVSEKRKKTFVFFRMELLLKDFNIDFRTVHHIGCDIWQEILSRLKIHC